MPVSLLVDQREIIFFYKISLQSQYCFRCHVRTTGFANKKCHPTISCR